MGQQSRTGASEPQNSEGSRNTRSWFKDPPQEILGDLRRLFNFETIDQPIGKTWRMKSCKIKSEDGVETLN